MATTFSVQPFDHVSRIQLLLHEIDFHYVAPNPPDTDFLDPFHEWMHNELGPGAGHTWYGKKLLVLEDTTATFAERCYPWAAAEIKLIIAKLTAAAIIIDDSVEDEEMYEAIAQFAHRLYLGEPQRPGILALYEESMRELSKFVEGDAVLRGLAVIPWIKFIDGCLLEKRLLTVDNDLRASPLDTGYQRLLAENSSTSVTRSEDGRGSYSNCDPNAAKFPHWLRHATGVAEPYAAAIFKGHRGQELPLSRYIMAIPDLTFFIEVINDLLSFHKEQLAGETANLVYLRTQSLHAEPGTGPSGEWTPGDTINLLCNEVRDATHRIDKLLKLDEYERSPKDVDDVDVQLDMAIAKQWRGWRDGYIAWHLECVRYKLDFMRPKQYWKQE